MTESHGGNLPGSFWYPARRERARPLTASTSPRELPQQRRTERSRCSSGPSRIRCPTDQELLSGTEHQISDVRVHLVSEATPGGLADATRAVESIGFAIVRVRTASGFEGIGVTYHEVGGEATQELILRNMAPRLIGQDPFATEDI